MLFKSIICHCQYTSFAYSITVSDLLANIQVLIEEPDLIKKEKENKPLVPYIFQGSSPMP